MRWVVARGLSRGRNPLPRLEEWTSFAVFSEKSAEIVCVVSIIPYNSSANTHKREYEAMQAQIENREARGALRMNASPELRRRIKVRAAELGTTMRGYVTEAVLERLDREDVGNHEK